LKLDMLREIVTHPVVLLVLVGAVCLLVLWGIDTDRHQHLQNKSIEENCIRSRTLGLTHENELVRSAADKIDCTNLDKQLESLTGSLR
jgi:hypothetical protein